MKVLAHALAEFLRGSIQSVEKGMLCNSHFTEMFQIFYNQTANLYKLLGFHSPLGTKVVAMFKSFNVGSCLGIERC